MRKTSAKLCDGAIYTRKSTEEGLEQDFNSLQAQREAAEAYIPSQNLAGWTALPDSSWTTEVSREQTWSGLHWEPYSVPGLRRAKSTASYGCIRSI